MTPGHSITAAEVSNRFQLQRRAVTLFALFALLSLVAHSNAVFAQTQSPAKSKPTSTPSSDRKPGASESAVTATGTIKGRLVSDDGQPLINASVLAQTVTGEPSAKPARVDADGRFVFDDLPAAVYIVIATAPGYIDSSVSQGYPSQWPRYLIGDQLMITMIKGGVITGTVTNSRGEPIVGIPVHALPAQGPQSSLVNFLSGEDIDETDDRGIYRIYGLPPGQYTIAAGGSAQFGRFGGSGFDLDVPTYFPSSPRDTAVPVAVRGGEETTGIDIKQRGAEGHSISGVVLGTIEANANYNVISILLSHAGTASVLSFEIANVADSRRTFSFNGIADGEYDVVASFLVGPNKNAVVGAKRVNLRGGDVSGVELRLAPLASFAGTLALDPIKPEDKCDKRGSQLVETRVDARRDDTKKSGSQIMSSMFSGFGATLNAKGEFAMRNLENGRYRLNIKLPTESWYVRAINLPGAAQGASQSSGGSSTSPPASASSTSSAVAVSSAPSSANSSPAAAASAAAVANQSNVWQGAVTLKSGEQVNGVSIMIGQDAASLRGRVSAPQEGTAIPPGLRVHLVPADPHLANNILRYSESFVTSDGSFEFTNVAPGRYFILSRLETPAEADALPRPVAWEPAERAKLRRQAEAANTIVELKPCQLMIDYPLKPGTQQ